MVELLAWSIPKSKIRPVRHTYTNKSISTLGNPKHQILLETNNQQVLLDALRSNDMLAYLNALENPNLMPETALKYLRTETYETKPQIIPTIASRHHSSEVWGFLMEKILHYLTRYKSQNENETKLFEYFDVAAYLLQNSQFDSETVELVWAALAGVANISVDSPSKRYDGLKLSRNSEKVWLHAVFVLLTQRSLSEQLRLKIWDTFKPELADYSDSPWTVTIQAEFLAWKCLPDRVNAELHFNEEAATPRSFTWFGDLLWTDEEWKQVLHNVYGVRLGLDSFGDAPIEWIETLIRETILHD